MNTPKKADKIKGFFVDQQVINIINRVFNILMSTDVNTIRINPLPLPFYRKFFCVFLYKYPPNAQNIPAGGAGYD